MHTNGTNDGSSRNRPNRVLVIDDHDMFRTGLASLLGAQPDIEVVAQASGGRIGVQLAAELAPDVVLMDLRLPDLLGVEATRAIIARRPVTRVLALTGVSDSAAIAAVLQAGASGFLAKDTPIEQIVVAVRAAVQGTVWLSPAAAKVVLGRMRAIVPQPGFDPGTEPELSSRELEVLRLIAQGMDNAEIAVSLGISPRTVKNHVSHVLAKLRVPSRVQAAIYAVRRGLA